MSRKFDFSIGEFYHLYNRGTDKRKIFSSNDDYKRFITLLYLCNSKGSVNINTERKSYDEMLDYDLGKRIVDIGAYCLMPNHFHILVRERVEGGISLFMQKLTTGYTMYFNQKNERSGSLFQGSFKATHLSDDEYLKYMYSYIHLNPIKLFDSNWKKNGIKNKVDAKNFLNKYAYSSYQEYVGAERMEKVILSPSAFPAYFERIRDFQKMIAFWLAYKDDEKFLLK